MGRPKRVLNAPWKGAPHGAALHLYGTRFKFLTGEPQAFIKDPEMLEPRGP